MTVDSRLVVCELYGKPFYTCLLSIFLGDFPPEYAFSKTKFSLIKVKVGSQQ